MGYQITWNIKDLPELDARFKGFWSKNPKDDIQEEKKLLLLSCMNYNRENINYKELKFKLKLFISLLEEQWKWDLKESLNKEDSNDLWYCGWEYSKDSYTDYDFTLDNICKEIYLYSFCTPELNILDEDSQFWAKSSRIEELLDDIEDAVYSKWSHDFVDTYRDYQIKDEEE